MKTIFNFFGLIIAFLFVTSSSLMAQGKGAEEIKTESSVPTEDIFIDDIVNKRIVLENKLMAQDRKSVV